MSTHAPYATLNDLPHYEKRADAEIAPWLKDESEGSRGHGSPPLNVACGSRSAPFATFHNAPGGYSAGEMNVPEQVNQPGSDSVTATDQGVHRVPCDGSADDHIRGRSHPPGLQVDLSLVHQAPWDRDEVIHKGKGGPG